MRYLKLAGAALEPVLSQIESVGEPKPNPILSVGFVAVDEEGNVKAQILVQSVCLVEPAVAAKGYGHCLGVLFKMAEQFIHESGVPRVMFHTDNRAMERMLVRAKAKRWPVKMWQWLRERG